MIVDADVHTMDPAHPHASVIAIDGGVFSYVGDSRDGLIGPRTHVVEANGTVTPGLVDAHAHLIGLGDDLEAVQLRGMASEHDAAAAAIHATGDGWLMGRGWDQNHWPGQAFPTHASIDAIARPTVLERVDGHAIWVNAAALAAAGITRATPDPEGGKIVRDARGEPTGVLIDNATALVTSKIPEPTAAQIEARIVAAAKVASEAGLTGVDEMGIDEATAAVYRKLASEGRLPLHVYAFLRADPANPPTQVPEPATGRFVMRGVKYYADGALGSRGARLLADYDDDPGNRGLWVTPPDVLHRGIEAAAAAGWQVAVHAIGDAAVHEVLTAYAEIEQACEAPRCRPRVEHLQIIAPDDIALLESTHAVASMQPTHATSDMPWAEARIGHARIAGAYAWRTMLDHHVPLAFGSDFPVEDVSPLEGLYAAVTREDKQGNPAGGWYPAQRMTLDEAIAGFTTGAAYAAWDADHGTIAVGRPADLTVFDRVIDKPEALLAAHATAWLDGRPALEPSEAPTKVAR